MGSATTNGVLQPLLPVESRKALTASEQRERDTFWPCAFNLSKAVTGAGMMAIPRAYLQIGSFLGTAMLIGVAALTYFTLAVLVDGSSRTGARTYSQLADVTCGRWVMKVLQLSVLCFCFGFSVVYLVVIRDILIGTPPACSGLLCELFGLDPTGPLADPHIVIVAVAVFICAPLLLLRSMDSLAFVNVVGVAAVLLLAAVAAGLGGAAVLQGTAYSIPMWPQWGLLGPTKQLQLEALTDVLPVILACYVAHQNLHPLMPLLHPYSQTRMCSVVAVALTISSAVFTTLSVGAALTFGPSLEMNVLNNLSEYDLAPLVGPDIARILSWAVRGGYLVSVLGSLLLFMHPLRSCLAEMLWASPVGGPGCIEEASCYLEGTVVAAASSACRASDAGSAAVGLENAAGSSSGLTSVDAECSVTESAAGTKPGSEPDTDIETATATAAAAANPVVAVAPELVGSSDESAQQQQWQQQQPRWQQLEQRWCYVLTYGLLTAMVLVAILVPSIWSALSAIGDLASTTQAFMIPGFIALVLAFRYEPVSSSCAKHETSEELQHKQQQQSGCLLHQMLAPDNSYDAGHDMLHGGQSDEKCEECGITTDSGIVHAACCSSANVTDDVETLKDAEAGCDVLQQQQQQRWRQHSTLLMSPLQQHPCMLQWMNIRRQRSLQCRAKGCGWCGGAAAAAGAGRLLHIVLGAFVVLLGFALFLNGVYARV